MEDYLRSFLAFAEANLSYAFCEGGVTSLTNEHDTGWRSLPFLLVAHAQSFTSHIDVANEPAFCVRSGECLCLVPGVHHHIHAEECLDNGRSVATWSHTRYELPGGIGVFMFLDPPRVIRAPWAERIRRLSLKMNTLAATPEPSFHTAARKLSAGFDLLAIIAEVSEVRPRSQEFIRYAGQIGCVLNHIRQNLDGNLRMDDLARVCGLSVSHFAAIFARAVGCPPGQHVQRMRMDRAQRLLTASVLSIKQVSALCGYESETHFGRQFRKVCGMSPTEYRDMALSKVM